MIDILAECILLVNQMPTSPDKKRILFLLSLLMTEACKNGQDQRNAGSDSEETQSKR